MNFFDHAITGFLSHYSNASYTLNLGLHILIEFHTFKGAVIMALLFWAWHDRDDDRSKEIAITIVIGCFVALVLTRIISDASPFRVRPTLDHSLPFTFSKVLSADDYNHWSSFPSDHASLFGALATGIFLLNPRIGLFAFFYIVTVICLPRVYFGLHYATDVLAGLAIGIPSMGIVALPPIRQKVTAPYMTIQRRFPGPFWGAYYYVTFEMASLFDGSKALADWFVHSLRHLLKVL